MAKPQKDYDAKDIGVLKGLEPVQKRPGMYTRTDAPNHMMQEVVDNAFDEGLAGHAKKISVEWHDDGSVSVEDDGRGIPVNLHPTEKRPAVEVIFTVLHSGGKFDKQKDSAYRFAGGLHGVGVSVTNALSKRLEVTVWRSGYEHKMAFEHGLVVEELSKKKLPEDQKDKHGTRIQAWPEGKYFEHPNLQPQDFERFLQSKAVLLGDVEVTWTRPGRAPITWHYPGGMTQYLEEAVENQEAWVTDRFQCSLSYAEDKDGFEEGEGFDLALGFLHEGRGPKASYVNLIPTMLGGKHELGLRNGLLEAVRIVADRMNAVPKGIKIESDDIMSNVTYVLSARILDPEFAGQTKDKMTSDSGQKLVYGLLKDVFELWLNDHPEQAKAILEVVVNEAIRRQKTTMKVDRKKSHGTTVLPGKLSDCENKDPKSTELFLVEGDSAGGSSKQGRDRATQAILPLRGKLLNTWEVEASKLAASQTIQDVSIAIGVDTHDMATKDHIDYSRLRYHKIVIMSDADIDGLHIQVLLLTLFYKHFPGLIERGHIWLAQPPLYRINAPAKRGSKTGPRKFYALDDKELDAIEKQLKKENVAYQVARFKGLGEMNPEQLWETTLDPNSRRMIRVSIKDHAATLEAFELMMAAKNTQGRKDWMESEGSSVDVDL